MKKNIRIYLILIVINCCTNYLSSFSEFYTFFIEDLNLLDPGYFTNNTIGKFSYFKDTKSRADSKFFLLLSLAILERNFLRATNELTHSGILNTYDRLITKLPPSTQANYKKFTTQIDDKINNFIEKIYKEEDQFLDKTLKDRIKSLVTSSFMQYSKIAVTNFIIYSLRSAIHSKLNKKNLKDISIGAIATPFLGIDNPFPKSSPIICLPFQIIDEIRCTLKGEDKVSLESKMKLQIKSAEDYVHALEILNPKKAAELKEKLNSFKKANENVISKKPSPLRDLGKLILEILIGTMAGEIQYMLSNYINEKYGDRLGLIKE